MRTPGWVFSSRTLNAGGIPRKSAVEEFVEVGSCCSRGNWNASDRVEVDLMLLTVDACIRKAERAGCKGIGSNLIELGGKLPVAIVKVCAHVKGEAVWKVKRSTCEKGSTSRVGLILLQIVEAYL